MPMVEKDGRVSDVHLHDNMPITIGDLCAYSRTSLVDVRCRCDVATMIEEMAYDD